MALEQIWYGGYKLKERLSISEPDLIQYLIAGDLIAYRSPDIDSEPYSKEYIKNLAHNNLWQYENDHGPWGFYYHDDDIRKFEKHHNITVCHDTQQITQQDIPSSDIQNETTERFFESIDSSIKDKENVFNRINDKWFIKYKGKSTILSDYKRIRYIVHLLDKPFVQINVVDLVNLFKAVKKENISEKIEKHSGAMKSVKDEWEGLSGEEKEDERGVSLTDLAIDGLTYEEKDRFEDQGYKILQQLKDAKGNKNQAVKEWIGFKNYLFNEYGLKTLVSLKGISFVQMHRPGPEVEKARKNVTNQIKNAIKDIEKEIPQLAQHLTQYIDTGKDCVYRPDDSNEIDWYIIW